MPEAGGGLLMFNPKVDACTAKKETGQHAIGLFLSLYTKMNRIIFIEGDLVIKVRDSCSNPSQDIR